MARAKGSDLKSLVAELRGEGIEVGSLSEVLKPTEAWSTGNVALDSVLGVGGFPVGRIIELYGASQAGKAQPLDAKVLTPHGYKNMGDIQYGDWVMTPRGVKARVVGIYPQGEQDIYRITMSDGTSCEATGDHLWEVRKIQHTPKPRKNRPSPKTSFGGYNTVATTLQLKSLMDGKDKHGQRLYLPKIGAMDYGKEKIRFQIHPYVMGVLLGDGSFRGGKVSITNVHQSVLDRVAECEPRATITRIGTPEDGISYYLAKPEQSYKVRRNNTKNGGWNGFFTAARHYGLWGKYSYEKFIPTDYKLASVAQRKELIFGMLDAAGTASKRGYVTYCTSSKQLADDLMEVVYSVGWSASITLKEKTKYKYGGEELIGRPCWRVQIRADDPPFTLLYKSKRWRQHLKKDETHKPRRIVGIELVRRAEAQCIMLDDPQHLYVTDGMIPTHNTSSAIQAAAVLQQKIKAGEETGYILFLDFEHAVDLDYCRALGLDVDHETFLYMAPTTIERGINTYRKLLASGELRLCIVDSVAAMVSEKEAEAETGSVQVADRAKALYQVCRQILAPLQDNRSSIIFLNHLLDAIPTTPFAAKFGKQQYTPGGKAIGYYASVRVEFQSTGKLKTTEYDPTSDIREEAETATKISAVVRKNKVSKPGRVAKMVIRYGKGFSQPYSVFQVLVAHKVVEKKGAWYYPPAELCPKGKEGFHGEEKALIALENDPELLEKWTKKAVECINGPATDDTLDFIEDDEYIDPNTGEILKAKSKS